MILITPTLAIDEQELHEAFIRAPGPGGQNVNKVATAVQLRFDVAHSPSLPEAVRERLRRLARSRISEEGVLTITAHRFRTQTENRQDAREQLVALVRQAAQPPKLHRKTRPPLAAKRKRLEAKRRRGETKQRRRVIIEPNE